VDIPGEGYTFDIDQLRIGASEDGEYAVAAATAFIGHMQNFFVDSVDIITLLQQHAYANDSVHHQHHAVLANTGQLTYRQLPIPVHAVTLTPAADMAYLNVSTLDLSHGNATLKLMFKKMVSNVMVSNV